MIGLLHGLEPGHGWPVAVMYSMQKRNPVISGAISSSIIGMGHLISSIAVVVAYVLLQNWLNFSAPWLKYLAAGLLFILAIKLFMEKTDPIEKQHGHIHEDEPETKHEHEHGHPRQGRHTHWHEHAIEIALSLWGLATFAFILGRPRSGSPTHSRQPKRLTDSVIALLPPNGIFTRLCLR